MNMGAQEAELRALMMASQAGDAAAHRKLLEQLSGHLRGYFKRRLVHGDSEQAEDLVQETLLAIHTNRQNYNPAQLLTPWAYAIARYRLIDYLRKTKSSMANVPLEEAEEVMAHDDQVEVESAFDLGKLMSRLPSKAQQAIRYVKLDGLTVTEAAARTGMSESAIKVSIHRGLKALTAMMGQEKKS